MVMRPGVKGFSGVLGGNVPISDVIARWSLDSANPLVSDNGSGATLTLQSGCALADAVAAGNKGLVFSPVAGTNSATAVGAVMGGVVLPPDFTIWARVRFDDSGRWGRIFDFGDGPGVNNVLVSRYGASNQLAAFVAPCAANVYSPAILVTGAWISVALTCSSLNRRFALYVNGALQVNGAMTGDLPIKVRSNMFVGRSNWAADAAFRGAMDDLVVYRRELAATEIGALA